MSMLPVQLCLDLEPMVVALVQARFDLQVEEPIVVATAAAKMHARGTNCTNNGNVCLLWERNEIVGSNQLSVQLVNVSKQRASFEAVPCHVGLYGDDVVIIFCAE